MQMQPQTADQVFHITLEKLCHDYLPSRHPFFQKLAAFPSDQLRSSPLLSELYFRYQAACHATRVMAYHLPHLDTPALRTRKFKVLQDDDGLENGDAHHYQLRRAFEHIGSPLMVQDEVFGGLDELQTVLDPVTAKFVTLVQTLYPQSLGAWCIVEGLADNWMKALMSSLSTHFPTIQQEPYFAACFSQKIEERHAEDSREMTQLVLARSPALLAPTLQDAHKMAEGIDQLWSGLEQMLEQGESETVYSRLAAQSFALTSLTRLSNPF